MGTQKSILATLAYHDIFQFPLRISEISNFLIGIKSTQKQLETEIKFLLKDKKVSKSRGYFVLGNRLKSISLRITRERYSEKKLKKAQKYAKILGLIPTIRFVGITGALAMKNCTQKDDIDMLIITQKGTLWTTRFLANFLLFPVKRKPGSGKINDRACLNIFIDESDLRIGEANLYTAHEICQIMPLWQRDHAYEELIKANSWVKKYLPNWQKPTVVQNRGVLLNFSIFNSQFSIIETALKKLQLNYMRRRITKERLGETQLFFHPSNTQEQVLKEYNLRVKGFSPHFFDILR